MRGGLWGTCAAGCHASCPTRRRSSRPGRLAARGTARSLHRAHIASRPLQSARASACTRQTCAGGLWGPCAARVPCSMPHASLVQPARSPGSKRHCALAASCSHRLPAGAERARQRVHSRETCAEVCGARALQGAMQHAPPTRRPEQPARSPGSKRHCALAASCSHGSPAAAERARERVHQANMSGGLWGPCADVCLAACPTRRWCSRPGRLAARGTARSLHLAHMASPAAAERARQRVHQGNMSGGLWGTCAAGCHAACPTRRRSSRPGRLAAKRHCALAATCSHGPPAAAERARERAHQEHMRGGLWGPGCQYAGTTQSSALQWGLIRAVSLPVRFKVPCSMSPSTEACALASCSHRLPAGAEPRASSVHQGNMRGGLWARALQGAMQHAPQPARSPGSKRHCSLAASCSHGSRPLQSARSERVHQANCQEVCAARALTCALQHAPRVAGAAGQVALAARGTARSLHRAHIAPRPLQSARCERALQETCAEVCGARALQGAMQHAPRVAGAAGQVAWQQKALRARCILLTWPPGRCRARARARAPGKHVRRSVGPVLTCAMQHAPRVAGQVPGSKRHCALAASCSHRLPPVQSARASACTRQTCQPRALQGTCSGWKLIFGGKRRARGAERAREPGRLHQANGPPAAAERARDMENMRGGLWGPAEGTARSLHLAHVAPRPLPARAPGTHACPGCQHAGTTQSSALQWGLIRAVSLPVRFKVHAAHTACPTRCWCSLHACSRGHCARCILLTWPPGRCRARARARAPGKHVDVCHAARVAGAAGQVAGSKRHCAHRCSAHIAWPVQSALRERVHQANMSGGLWGPCADVCSMPHASPEQPARSPGSKRHCALAASCSRGPPAAAERARERAHQANMRRRSVGHVR